MIAPDDAALIHDGSEMRRKWLDAVISQYDRGYLEALIDVNKSLAQRNALLRYFAENRTFDATMLSSWNARMAPKAAKIAAARTTFMDDFLAWIPVHLRGDFRWGRGGVPVVEDPRRGGRGQPLKR